MEGTLPEGGRVLFIALFFARFGRKFRLIFVFVMGRIGTVARLALATLALFAQSGTAAAQAEASVPEINSILDALERVPRQNPARSQPYDVTRQYTAFRATDKEPIASVTVRITFTPPNKKSFKILKSSGHSRGRKIVRDLLKQETEPLPGGRTQDINRANYDFVFLRQDEFDIVPEYVLHIVPKRREGGLILGQIGVDSKTFRIRKIEGVPAKSQSFWVTDIYVALQFGEANGLWLPVSLDSIATVGLIGRYTLTGAYVG